jgi:MoxR-like ATPase
MAIPILRHRILLNFHAESDKVTPDDVLRRIMEQKPAPKA